jgi:hypothetical protein
MACLKIIKKQFEQHKGHVKNGSSIPNSMQYSKEERKPLTVKQNLIDRLVNCLEEALINTIFAKESVNKDKYLA